jgi:hypothetical protein
VSVFVSQPSDFGLVVPDLSTQTPLSGSASFTSPWIETRAIATVRIGILTDKAGTLRTQHSDDGGVTILRDSQQPVEANKGEFLSFHPRNAWFRIVFDNGSSAQTAFHLETVVHTIATPPTQSLVSAKLGRTSLAIQSRDILYDYETDETAGIAPQIRDLQTVQRTSLIADNFRQSTGLDLQTWDTAVTGTGTATVANGRLEVRTGATANSTAEAHTEALGRFISGSHQVFRAGIKITDSGTANNKRRWGAFDATSGYFYELDGTTLYAVSRRAATDTRVASSAWSDITSFGNGTGGSARYEIIYFGNTAIFAVNGETHHRMSGEVGGLPRTNGTNFPNRFECNNSGGSTSDVTLVITGTSQQRYGPDNTSPRYKRVTGTTTTVLKSDSGRFHRMIVGKGAGTVTIYDNTAASGTVIANLELEQKGHYIEFMVDFYNGLTVSASDAGADITYIYD